MKNIKINSGMSSAIVKGLIRVAVFGVAKSCLNDSIYASVMSKAIYDQLYQQQAAVIIAQSIPRDFGINKEVFNKLLGKLLKVLIVDILDECKGDIRRELASGVLDGMISSAVNSMLYKKSSASSQIALSLYNSLHKKELVKVCYGCLQSQIASHLVLESMLKDFMKIYTRKFIKIFLEIPRVIGNITDRYANSWAIQITRKVVLNELAVASTFDSLVNSLCLAEMRYNMREEEEIDLDEQEEMPKVSVNTIKSIPSFLTMTKVTHAKEVTADRDSLHASPVKISYCPPFKQERLPSLDSILSLGGPGTSRTPELRSLGDINSELQTLLNELNEMPHTKPNASLIQLKIIATSALKTNWNPSVLEKLEGDLRKIVKKDVTELCESVAVLVREKVRTLKKGKEEESEELKSEELKFDKKQVMREIESLNAANEDTKEVDVSSMFESSLIFDIPSESSAGTENAADRSTELRKQGSKSKKTFNDFLKRSVDDKD
eukprot:TRINITY_DN1391_c0_g5_i1.p1 TRINITY_DN1391_c0_g5~~TRINITY_DN1391_c0_g5_i1.p1  ORF type:complete len:492 (+),score=88.85 TRINITY_DN1391_c0_g5_i1:163-1638(+)